MTERSMTAIVEFQIRKENTTMGDWLLEWGKRADDARVGEPETLAYEAAVSLEDDSHVLIFERYLNGASSLKLHSERPAHARLNEVMGERKMTRRRVMSSASTDVPDYGWWVRPDRALEADGRTPGGTILVIGAMRFAEPAMRDPFLELAKTHAAYCWEREPDTLIYSGGFASADSDRVDIKRDDLIFVMECTDLQAVDKHRDDPNHVALGEQLEAEGIQMEVPYRQMYRTTGKGFTCRNASR